MIAAKIKPLDLGTLTAVTILLEFKYLAIAFAGPEFLRCATYFVDSWLAAKHGLPGFFPWWLTKAVDLFLVSLMLALIVRYLVLKHIPQLLPRSLPWKPIGMVPAIMIPLWFILELITDQRILVKYYDPFAGGWSEDKIIVAVFLFSMYSFILHAASIALFYPLLAIIASTNEFKLKKYLFWIKRQYGRFFILSILLTACTEALRLAYGKLWQLTNGIFLSTPELGFDWKYTFIEQMSYVPADFLYIAVPSVAVSLIYIELRKSDQIL